MSTQTLDALQSALLGTSFDTKSDTAIAVKAEDVQTTSGIAWDKIFFEPQPGKTYTIKFLPNPKGELITHRSIYRNLPDPHRKGKTFRYISSGSAKTCPALELFFDLHALKKEGDVVAEKKIDMYLGRTNQACVRVQILNSPEKEEIGKIKLYVFSTAGVNAAIATLINQKLNPTKEQIADGFEREDIFNIFESSVLSLVCEEAIYEGNKGRDYSKSVWVPKKRGAIAINENGESREFKKDDVVDGKLTEEATPWFQSFFNQLETDYTDIKKQFAYKDPTDETLDEETRKYVKDIFAKVNEIIPVIREKSLAEIAKYGRVEKIESSDNNNVTNIHEDSIPDELKDSTSLGTNKEKTNKEKATNVDSEVDAILNEE